MKTKTVRRAYRQTCVIRVLETLAFGGGLNCYEAVGVDVFSLKSAISGLRKPRRYDLRINESTESVHRNNGKKRLVRYTMDAPHRERAMSMLLYLKMPRYVRVKLEGVHQ